MGRNNIPPEVSPAKRLSANCFLSGIDNGLNHNKLNLKSTIYLILVNQPAKTHYLYFLHYLIKLLTMELSENIKEKAKACFDEIVQIRRHLHKYPELSFHEHETSAFIADRLRLYGIETKKVAGTGLVARITGSRGKGKTIALRAELDALPIQEETGLPYCSTRPGIMHACGHDVHAACLAGSAKIIKELQNQFAGTVYLVFQPGEESLPGGAIKMLDEGLFDNEEPDLIIAQHVMPELDAGQAGIRPGMYMASGDEIYIDISGQGGHGAMPHTTVDTVAVMSQIVVALQQITSRFAPPNIPTVLTFGKFIANGATNVIPPKASLEGTFRTMDETWRANAHEKIKAIATGIADALGAACNVEIRKGYPVLHNHPDSSMLVKRLMERFIGTASVKELPVRMTTEDFAWFAMKYPAVFYRLGTGMAGRQLHSPGFDIDERIMETGTGLMAWLALSFLGAGENETG
jgi:amidohydrolase